MTKKAIRFGIQKSAAFNLCLNEFEVSLTVAEKDSFLSGTLAK